MIIHFDLQTYKPYQTQRLPNGVLVELWEYSSLCKSQAPHWIIQILFSYFLYNFKHYKSCDLELKNNSSYRLKNIVNYNFQDIWEVGEYYVLRYCWLRAVLHVPHILRWTVKIMSFPSISLRVPLDWGERSYRFKEFTSSVCFSSFALSIAVSDKSVLQWIEWYCCSLERSTQQFLSHLRLGTML